MRRWGKEFVLAPVCGALLFPSAIITVQRNLIWQDNLSLYRDTLKKSPQFTILRNELGIALIKHGQKAAAAAQFEKARAEDPKHRILLFSINQAKLDLDNNKPSKARLTLIKVGAKSPSADIELLSALASVDEKRLFALTDKEERTENIKELIEIYARIYKRSHDPVKLYRRGQLALYLKDRKLAADCFSRAYAHAPEDAYYKLAAKKLAAKLSRE